MSIIKSVIYKSLDTITLGRGVKKRVNDFTIQFPTRWARYYPSDYEPETFDFVKKHCKSGDVVLDIGAHIGLFGVVIAQIVGKSGKIYCFEPTPFTREILTEIINLNKCSDIVKVQGEAVSDAKGKTTFYDTGDSAISNANSLVKTNRSGSGFEVQITTVDDFASENNLKINCLKIDVEGAELNLLRGAAQTFLKDRPIAHLSLHPQSIAENNQSLSEIWDLLEEYKLKITFKDESITKDWFCSHDNLFDVCLFPEII